MLRPSDLGKYLLYDENSGYLVSDGQTLRRQTSLTSDISEVNGKVVVQDRLQSEGEWQLLAASEWPVHAATYQNGHLYRR